MASLRERNGKFEIIFRYLRNQHTFTLDETDPVAAVGAKAQIAGCASALWEKPLQSHLGAR
jgi:hypothetical protein